MSAFGVPEYRAAELPPSILISKLSINPRPKTVVVLMVVCLANGPGAKIVTTETLRRGTRVVARQTMVDPLGVDLTRTYSWQCDDVESGWLRADKFFGRGTYVVTMKLVDGFGRGSRTVGFSVTQSYP